MTQLQNAVCHRWADLPRDYPMAHLERRRIIGQHAMLSEVRLQKGCVVPTHAHDNEQFACVLSGSLRFTIGDEGSGHEVVARTGDVLHLPSNVPHAAEALEDTRVLDLFAPPSETTGVDRATH